MTYAINLVRFNPMLRHLIVFFMLFSLSAGVSFAQKSEQEIQKEIVVLRKGVNTLKARLSKARMSE